jgi:ring-1,2-phenylacetyl-CoA epoxidase subunit PaaD
MDTVLTQPTIAQVWEWLAELPDPEIPVISVVDLGIVRDVAWRAEDKGAVLVVTITPTYSGCPATRVISTSIADALAAKGVGAFRLEQRIAPPWTTDWISERGRQRLKEYGIAPPDSAAEAASPLSRLTRKAAVVSCPRCGSTSTVRVSEFGSTPCKAQYRCQGCLEPFDYFKCI